MKQVTWEGLYSLVYSIKLINALAQAWDKTKSFSCFGAPKACHMLLYLENGEARYTVKTGKTLCAPCGSIVFIPRGAEYVVRFGGEAKTIHVNFHLADEKDEPFSLGETITVLTPNNADYKALFERIDRYGEANAPSYARMLSLTYELFFLLSEFYRRDSYGKYGIIANGIAYL